MTRRGVILALAALALAPAPGRGAADSGVVEVEVVFQEYDSFSPWQKRPPGVRRGYGVRISENQVITTESLVRNAELVELRKPRTGEKIPAAVQMSDCQINLACLRVRGAAALEGVRPLELCARFAASNRVSILQLDETSEIQRGEGQIMRISVSQLPRAPYAALTFTLLTDLNVNGEGAPVLCEGRLAGLMMSYNWNTRTGQMLPHAALRRFLRDLDEPPYRGIAAAGFIWSDLVDPVKRAYLKVEGRSGGIQVLACLPGSGAGDALRPNDVVVEWDGRALDNLGFYDDPDFGRLGFPYLIMGHREPGDAVPVTIVRAGLETNLTVRLSRYRDEMALVPDNVTGEKPEYLVDGGLVIRELDGRYLAAHGAEWQQEADSRLVHAFVTRKFSPEKPGERVVILTGILPDAINVGYQRFRDEVVTRVNGQPVHKMADVFQAVDREQGLHRVTLNGFGVDLILDADELPAANRRLADAYRMSEMRFQRKTE